MRHEKELKCSAEAASLEIQQLKQAWELEKKSLESELQIQQTSLEWELDQLKGKLTTFQDVVSNLSQEKEDLKNNLLHINLQHKSSMEEKITHIKSLQIDLEQAEKNHERNIKECVFELERHQEQLKNAKETILALESTSAEHLGEIVSLRDEIHNLRKVDSDMASKYDQEQFLVESRHEHEIQRLQRDFDAAFKNYNNEKTSLKTEIKLMRARMIEMDARNVYLEEECRTLADRENGLGEEVSDINWL